MECRRGPLHPLERMHQRRSGERVGEVGRKSWPEELAGRATSASTALLNIPPPYCRPGRRRSQRSKTKGWGYSRPEGWDSDEARCHSDASHSGKEVSPS